MFIDKRGKLNTRDTNRQEACAGEEMLLVRAGGPSLRKRTV